MTLGSVILKKFFGVPKDENDAECTDFTFEMGRGQGESRRAQSLVCSCAGSALCVVCCEAVCFWSRVAASATHRSESAFVQGPLWARCLLVWSASGQLWTPAGSLGF